MGEGFFKTLARFVFTLTENTMKKDVLIKKTLVFAGVFCLCLFLIMLRFIFAARSEWKLAELDIKKDNVKNAVGHLDLAIRNYFPFSPYLKNSAGALIKIAEDYRKESKFQDSFDTYQILLSALSSVRHPFFSPPVAIKTIEKEMDGLKDKILSSQNNK